MNIGVYVSSNYSNYDRLSKMLTSYIRKYTTSPVILTALSPSTKPGHGNNLVKRYADENHIRCKVYETEWNKWKKSAGSIASYHINHNSERSLVFWDGLSKGCRNYLNMTNRLRRPCDLIRVNPNDVEKTSPSEQEKKELEIRKVEQQPQQQTQQQPQQQQSGQSSQSTQSTKAVQNPPSSDMSQGGGVQAKQPPQTQDAKQISSVSDAARSAQQQSTTADAVKSVTAQPQQTAAANAKTTDDAAKDSTADSASSQSAQSASDEAERQTTQS